jgi:SAM-dependent methyltransferase
MSRSISRLALSKRSEDGDRFWISFGLETPPVLDGLRVMEVGCGTGSRCIQAAGLGAARVLGIDPMAVDVAKATDIIDQKYPELKDRVEFRACYIADVADEGFDVIISENAFEHILDPGDVLAEMRKKLKEGGRVYLGFGPLYYSPFGDHGWIRAALPFGERLPWGHAVLPEWLLFKLMSWHYRRPVKNLTDWHFLTLNKLTPAEYRNLFAQSGLTIECCRMDVAFSRIGKLFARFRKIPFLEKYFTVLVCCILRKDPVPNP